MIHTEYPKDDIVNVLTLVDAMEGALRDPPSGTRH